MSAEAANKVDQISKYKRFCELHEQPGIFVIPNPWDVGSARILTALGFEALATTSAGLAFAIGKLDSSGGFDDSTGLTKDEVINNAASIVASTHLPVSADLEGGYGDKPEDCSSIIASAIEIGLVGGSIEDATGLPDQPFYSFDLAVERIYAAAEVSRDRPFLLTARTENYLYGKPDLADTIKKLKAFEKAGADVLFAPGLNDLDDIRAICTEVTKPVNVLMGIRQPTFTVDELAQAGVKRVSVGGGFARAAISGLFQAALEVKEKGSFTYTADIITNAEAVKMTSG